MSTFDVGVRCAGCAEQFNPASAPTTVMIGDRSVSMHWRCRADVEKLQRLPPFSGLERKCPKCGGFVDTEHVELHGYLNYELGVTELLTRKCSRCNHKWDEATLDAGS